MGKLRALEELFLSLDSKSFSFRAGEASIRYYPSLNICTIFCFFSKEHSHLGLSNLLPRSSMASGCQGSEFSTSSQTALQMNPHLPGTTQAFLI